MNYHPDDEDDEDGICGPTWYLEWDMWVFILLCLLSLAGVWQMGEWACDLWNWAKGGLL